MRPAPAERRQAEEVLEQEGWLSVNISKDLVKGRAAQYHEICKWCEDNIGAGRLEPGPNWLDDYDVWYSYSWYGFWTFHFKHAKDATAFTLRWV